MDPLCITLELDAPPKKLSRFEASRGLLTPSSFWLSLSISRGLLLANAHSRAITPFCGISPVSPVSAEGIAKWPLNRNSRMCSWKCGFV